MLSYEQALAIIESSVQALAPARVRPRDALGWVSAESLACPSAVPPFDNSAMDGFAVRSADTSAASGDSPAALEIIGTVLAGDAGNAHATPMCAHEIMTGAPIPAGYDSVVPVERVSIRRDPDGKPLQILLSDAVASGSNLRSAGEDFAADAQLLHAGQLIGANQIMGLAATGVSGFMARRRPRVMAITTGNELTDSATLARGMIHDSNGPYLGAAIPGMGAECTSVDRIADSDRELIGKIENAEDCPDVIITTGGVSAGRMDFVPRALELIGADILFHRVAIRPGKPILFARLPNGTWFFGLPGNPIAVAVGLRFFVAPALRMLQGRPREEYRMARLTDTLHKKPGLTFFAKARLTMAAADSTNVEILPGQESFKIRPLMEANCWAIVAPDREVLEAGATVPVAGSMAD
jgi:molybdopterin molybdotransferase